MRDPLTVPDTAVARAASAVCARYAEPWLAGHSVRSYLWAADHAHRHGIAFDAELLWVAAMVHDLALTPVFDAHAVPFEVTAGELGRVLVTGAGWTDDRAERVSLVAITHMRDDVGPDVDAESHLLQVGTTADVSGGGASDLPAGVVAAVLAAHPRHGFAESFARAFAAEAARKPGCATAGLVAGGIADRIRTNPLDR